MRMCNSLSIIFFSSRRRHTRLQGDWSSDVCSSDLQDNAGDDLFVSGDTTFTFATPVTNGGLYNVTLFLPPTSQPQRCNLFNRSEEHTSELQSPCNLVCRLLLEKKKKRLYTQSHITC